jgi:hypothetical protein
MKFSNAMPHLNMSKSSKVQTSLKQELTGKIWELEATGESAYYDINIAMVISRKLEYDSRKVVTMV